jgi:hypothetical protein
MTELTAISVDTPIEALLDRTACLVPDVQIFEADGAWAKPAHALWVDFFLINQGQTGADGDGYFGGGGGAGGVSKHMIVPAASVPANLTVTVSNSVGEESSAVDALGLGFDVRAVGISPTLPMNASGKGGAGGTATANTYTSSESGSGGGDGAASATGGRAGTCGPTTAGGAGGAAGDNPGKGGRGYGAGGGGGKPAGGGGGGGYGNVQLAADGSSSSDVGGVGAAGVVVITTWRGVAI